MSLSSLHLGGASPDSTTEGGSGRGEGHFYGSETEAGVLDEGRRGRLHPSFFRFCFLFLPVLNLLALVPYSLVFLLSSSLSFMMLSAGNGETDQGVEQHRSSDGGSGGGFYSSFLGRDGSGGGD